MLLAETMVLNQETLQTSDVGPNRPLANDNRPPIYNSAELLQGCREAWIEHGQQMYRLRLTQAGKLYLTK